MLPMLHVLVLKFIKLVKYNINSNNEEAVGVVVGKEKFSALLAGFALCCHVTNNDAVKVVKTKMTYVL